MMSLRKDIEQAQARAAAEEARKSLRTQRRNFASLDSLMHQIHNVDAVLSLTKRGNNWLLVLPVSSKKPVSLEEDFSGAVESALAEYSPTRTEYE